MRSLLAGTALAVAISCSGATITIPECDTLTIISQTFSQVNLACGHNPPPGGPTKVLVVPLRYQSPPSTDPAAIQAYNQTLPQVTQASLQTVFTPIAAWWSQETYGLKQLDITVMAATDVPGSPVCDWSKIRNDALAAVGNTPYNVLVVVTPYACWQNHASTGGNVVVNWNTYQSSQGTNAHEIGHALGLYHNAQRMPNYIEYGSGTDQMGSLSNNLLRFLAPHKQKLGVLTPKPCVSTTLRSVYQYPDAIQCGMYTLDYLPDWNQVWVHLNEFVPSSYGGSDVTDVAKLSPGQSFTAGSQTFRYNGNGSVTVQ